MRSSEVYFDDTGKIRKVYAPDEFIAENIEIEKKMAAEAAEANRKAQLQETRKILTFYNALQKQQQNPQPSLSLEQQRQPTTQQSSNNVLKHLQLMRRIAGEDL
jgi:hypothetical protein